MYKLLGNLIRILLSAGLCFLVFTETGVWTASFALLILLYFEYNTFVHIIIYSDIIQISNALTTLIYKLQLKDKNLKSTDYVQKEKDNG